MAIFEFEGFRIGGFRVVGPRSWLISLVWLFLGGYERVGKDDGKGEVEVGLVAQDEGWGSGVGPGCHRSSRDTRPFSLSPLMFQ